MHSGVIDTVVLPIFSNIFEAIYEKALTSVSGAKGKLFDEKSGGPKTCARVPLRCKLTFLKSPLRGIDLLGLWSLSIVSKLLNSSFLRGPRDKNAFIPVYES
jgi:CBS domain containing-hemolysin-like protein